MCPVLDSPQGQENDGMFTHAAIAKPANLPLVSGNSNSPEKDIPEVICEVSRS